MPTIITDKTQGKVKFLTGGKPRDSADAETNRCNSGGDSKVWMEELIQISILFSTRGFYLRNPVLF